MRGYDPVIGRWNATDPLSDLAPNWSGYRYGYNNPMRFTDMYGLWEKDENGNWTTTNQSEIADFLTAINGLQSTGGNIELVDGEDEEVAFKLYSIGDNGHKSYILPQRENENRLIINFVNTLNDALFTGGLTYGLLENSIYSKNMFTGTEIWHGKTTNRYYNSKYIPQNNYVYNRSRLKAISDSKAFRLGARSLFFASALLSVNDMVQNPSTVNIMLGSGDVVAGFAATFGGPPGVVAGVSYIALTSHYRSLYADIKAGRAGYNNHMMTNYMGGLAPTPYIYK